MRNIGVAWRNEVPRLKVFISGTIDESLLMCRHYKQNPEQIIFLKSIEKLKRVYGENILAMEIDVEDGVLLKSSFEIYFDREETSNKKFVNAFAANPFFSDYVTKQQKDSFKKFFTQGAQAFQTTNGSLLHMKAMHVKVVHLGKGIPQWKLYLNFVKHPLVKKQLPKVS